MRDRRTDDSLLIPPRWFYLAVLLMLMYLSYVIVRPVFMALALGMVAAYVFYPVFEYFKQRIGRPNLSAFLCSLLGLLMIIIPIFLLVNSMATETGQLYGKAKELILKEDLFACPEVPSTITCRFLDKINSLYENPEVKAQLAEWVKTFVQQVSTVLRQVIFSLPRLIVFLFVSVLSMFYLLRDGHFVVSRLKEALPLSKHHQNVILEQLQSTMRGVIYGTLIVAVVQALLALLGFYFLGIPNPVFWSIVLALFAFLPFIGSWIVWFPAGISLILQGEASGGVARGIILLIYGFLIISGVENVLRPLLVGSSAKVPSLVILLGVMGGILVWGPMGFVLGPIVLSLFKTFFDIYAHERKRHGG